jgi:hypothetical protein
VLRDLAPVASFMRVPNVMEVSPTLPVKTVPEFITYAKADPGKVMFASSGVGTTIHMSGELFKAMAGLDMLHVPYRGLAAGGYADLMTGAVHVTFECGWRAPPRKKRRSGLQSACDELIDKGASSQANSGCMRPELGEFIQ